MKPLGFLDYLVKRDRRRKHHAAQPDHLQLWQKLQWRTDHVDGYDIQQRQQRSNELRRRLQGKRRADESRHR